MRVLGLYRRAAQSLSLMAPEVRAALEAYAAGVNAWIEHHPGFLPLEFLVPAHAPDSWQPVDSLVWAALWP